LVEDTLSRPFTRGRNVAPERDVREKGESKCYEGSLEKIGKLVIKRKES